MRTAVGIFALQKAIALVNKRLPYCCLDILHEVLSASSLERSNWLAECDDFNGEAGWLSAVTAASTGRCRNVELGCEREEGVEREWSDSKSRTRESGEKLNSPFHSFSKYMFQTFLLHPNVVINCLTASASRVSTTDIFALRQWPAAGARVTMSPTASAPSSSMTIATS